MTGSAYERNFVNCVEMSAKAARQGKRTYLLTACFLENLADLLKQLLEIKYKPEDTSEWIVDVKKYGSDDIHCKKCGAIVEKFEENNHFWAHCYHCGRKMTKIRGRSMIWDD